MSDDIVARFEPARAAVRPSACDERGGCWVKVGSAAWEKGTTQNGRCTACHGPLYFVGAERQHAAALARCYRAQGTSS
jgi:hypothetical protein